MQAEEMPFFFFSVRSANLEGFSFACLFIYFTPRPIKGREKKKNKRLFFSFLLGENKRAKSRGALAPRCRDAAATGPSVSSSSSHGQSDQALCQLAFVLIYVVQFI